MGYMCRVHGKIEKKYKKELIEAIEKDGFDEEDFDYQEDKKYLYFGNICKWFNCDIDNIDEFMEKLDQKGGIIIIGEDGATSEYGDPSAVDMYLTQYVEGFPNECGC